MDGATEVPEAAVMLLFTVACSFSLSTCRSLILLQERAVVLSMNMRDNGYKFLLLDYMVLHPSVVPQSCASILQLETKMQVTIYSY